MKMRAPGHARPASRTQSKAQPSRGSVKLAVGGSTPDLLPPRGSVDKDSVVTVAEKGAVRETKEWQAIMDYLRSLPAKNQGELPTLPVDARAAEVRASKAGVEQQK